MKRCSFYAVACVLLRASSAAAAEWNFYGSARMGAWSIGQNPQWAANPLTDGDHRTTSFALQPNSRIGARIAAGAISENDYRNNTAWGASAVVNYKFNGRWAAETGYGYMEARRDGWTDSDGGRSYYILVPITLADAVTITPEFTVFDAMDDETDAPEGTETCLGAKVQINF